MNKNQQTTLDAIRQTAQAQNEINGHALSLAQLGKPTADSWRKKFFMALRLVSQERFTRERRLRYYEIVFGRPLQSTDDLTWPECKAFIQAAQVDFLRQDLQELLHEPEIQRLR
jgi:hypothetical protein